MQMWSIAEKQKDIIFYFMQFYLDKIEYCKDQNQIWFLRILDIENWESVVYYIW